MIPEITSESYPRFRDVIKGCQSRDVTGGMASKVENMIDLCSSEATDKVTQKVTKIIKRMYSFD